MKPPLSTGSVPPDVRDWFVAIGMCKGHRCPNPIVPAAGLPFTKKPQPEIQISDNQTITHHQRRENPQSVRLPGLLRPGLLRPEGVLIRNN